MAITQTNTKWFKLEQSHCSRRSAGLKANDLERRDIDKRIAMKTIAIGQTNGKNWSSWHRKKKDRNDAALIFQYVNVSKSM